MNVKISALSLCSMILGIGVFACPVQAQTSPLPLPDVFVSSSNLAQADTLLVMVKNEPSNATGRIGPVKLHFFRSENGADWIAIVGIPVNKKPGNYALAIAVHGKQAFRKTIAVAKRKFPIVNMTITPELLQ